jgi:outer membrane protein
MLTQVRDDAVRQIVLADNARHTSLSILSACRTLEMAARTTFDAARAACRNGGGSITGLTVAETQLPRPYDTAAGAYSTALSSAATLASRALGSAPDYDDRAAT